MLKKFHQSIKSSNRKLNLATDNIKYVKILYFFWLLLVALAATAAASLPSCVSMCVYYYYSKLTFWHVFWIRDLKIIFCQKITVIFILGDHPKPPASLRFDQNSRPQNWPFGDLMTKCCITLKSKKVQFWEIIMFVSKAKIKILLIFFSNSKWRFFYILEVGRWGTVGADMGDSSTSSRLNFKPKNVVEPVL